MVPVGCGRIAFEPRPASCADLPPGSPSGTYDLAGCGDTGGHFEVTLAAPADSPLEARLMVDQGTPNEDLGIARMTLYVR